MGTVTTRPQYLNANTNIYTAWDLRRAFGAFPGGEGVEHFGSFRVLQRQAGANMSVDIGATGVGLMQAYVRGDTRGGQGIYTVDNIDRAAPTADTYVAQLNDVVTSNASGNPRLDQVILEIADQQHAGASNLAQTRVVAGTPTAGATLDNRSGAAALPASAIRLADILVANGAVSIVTADIRDRRQYPLMSVTPSLGATNLIDMVAMVTHPSMMTQQLNIFHALMDLYQVAALVYLPRRIASATRIRWKYTQGATAMAGNYVIGIYDASGRLIVDTGSVAFAGAASSVQVRSETITATTFEAGAHYVFLGVDSSTGGSSVSFNGINLAAVAQIPTPNIGFGATTGGVTVPTTILGLTDMGPSTAATILPPVPMISLSVG